MSESLNADNSTVQVQAEGLQGGVVENTAPPSPSDRMAYVTNMMNGGASTTEHTTEATQAGVQGEPAIPAQQEETTATQGTESVPQEPESRLEVPEKFKDEFGNIRPEFLKSYLHMEAMYGKQAQKISELARTVNALQEQIANPKEKEQEIGAELEIEFDKEEFLETLYEDPAKALQEWGTKWDSIKEAKRQAEFAKQQAANQEKVTFWQERIRECEDVYPDFKDLRPVIQEVIAANRDWMENAPNAIETAYWMAKGITLSQVAPPEPVQPSVDDLLKDESALSQIISNPEVQKQILSKHAQNVMSSPVPKIISGQPGAIQTATAPMEIKSTKDAMRASKSMFERLFGGG